MPNELRKWYIQMAAQTAICIAELTFVMWLLK